MTFRQRHCPHCLAQTVSRQKRYYHPVLEAKLVTPAGLALAESLRHELIPAESRDPARCGARQIRLNSS